MTTDKIIEQINQFQTNLLIKTNNGTELNNPAVLGETIVKIRVLLVTLVDRYAEADLEFRRLRAQKYDVLLKEGVKKSPAYDSLKMDMELIVLESHAERLRAYMKHVDGLVSSVQSMLKIQSGQERNQY